MAKCGEVQTWDEPLASEPSAFDAEFGSGYDVAILANILHNFDAGANIALLRKVHAALNPGGLAVIAEFAPNVLCLDDIRESGPT